MQIIPAINAKNFEEAKKQIGIAAQVVPAGGVIHIDVTDGRFSPAITWGEASQLANLELRTKNRELKIEVHLMVNNPELVIEDWLKAGIDRAIVHLEALGEEVLNIKRFLKKHNKKIVLALNPETPAEKLLPYLTEIEQVLILAVKPGWAGQKFSPEVIHKIQFLRKAAPSVKIEVDGGINLETAKLCKEAGADIVVSASYILNSDNPKEAYEKLTFI